MIDRKRLLLDLKKLLRTLEADLEERCATHPETDAHLREAYGKAREAGRTAQTYETWRQEPLTQAAVAWILSTVFVRFLEDNGLFNDATGPRRLLWGTTPELWRNAEERYTATIRARPSDSDREVFLGLFDEVGRLPGAHHLFDRRHNPAFTIGLTAEGAKALREACQATRRRGASSTTSASRRGTRRASRGWSTARRGQQSRASLGRR